MKQFFTLLFISLFFAFAQAQTKKDLVVSLSAGILNSPYYENAHASHFYGAEFDYYLSNRQIISAGYLAGQHEYYDHTLSNTNVFNNNYGTNSEARYNTFTVLYKYKIASDSHLSVIPGVGLGMMTHSREYPYEQGFSTSFYTSSWTDLVFPVSLEVNYKISNRWQAGITSGLLIHPDYPILALHVGPRLSYVLK